MKSHSWAVGEKEKIRNVRTSSQSAALCTCESDVITTKYWALNTFINNTSTISFLITQNWSIFIATVWNAMQPNVKKPSPCAVSLGSLQQQVRPTCPEKINACVWMTAKQDRWKQTGRPPDTFIRANKTCGHSSGFPLTCKSAAVPKWKALFKRLFLSRHSGWPLRQCNDKHLWSQHNLSTVALKPLIKGWKWVGTAPPPLALPPPPPPYSFSSSSTSLQVFLLLLSRLSFFS